MICPYCSSENKDNAKFCKYCGKSLNPVSTMKKEYLDAHDKTNKTKQDSNDNSSSFSSKNLIIICVTVIVCIGLIMGSVLYISFNKNNPSTNVNTDSALNNNENISDNSVNQSSDSNENNSNDVTTDTVDTTVTETDTVSNYNNIQIISGKFYTGHKLSDKTYCDIYVGSENAGTKLKIQIYYSRDGKTLNPGNIVPKTVDSDGYVSLRSANAFKYYPDHASIKLYDLEGNVLDSMEVTMSASKGTQTF